DNADQRLTLMGRDVGLIEEEQWEQYLERQSRMERLRTQLSATKPDTGHNFFVSRGLELRDRPTVALLLRRPEIHLEDLLNAGLVNFGSERIRREDLISVETAIKYEGYLRQQEREVERLRKAEARRIPENFEYTGIAGVSER